MRGAEATALGGTMMTVLLLCAAGAAAQTQTDTTASPTDAPSFPPASSPPHSPSPPDAPVPTALERLHEIEGHMRARPGSVALGIDRARALYFVGVSDRSAADRGLAQVEALRGSRIPASLLDAYQGAFETLHAKHAFWPVTKLRKVREGLRLLDAAVEASPDDAEIRYLRLMGGFYLPSLFGRGDEVREDLAVLARMTVQGEHALPPELQRVVTDFVLEHAGLPDSTAARVRAWEARDARIERPPWPAPR